ncbi:unnamed protein product [Prunus armeniaca]|nr:hypothetical protein GBA52_004123 [Prunus armeniaca]
MAASGSKPHPPSSSKPPKNPITLKPTNETQTPNPNPSTSKIPPIPPSQEEIALSDASHLTRPEVLRRRSYFLRQLRKFYKSKYWAFMEEVKKKHREFYWNFGVSPFKDEHKSDRDAAGNAEGTDENNNNINSNFNNNNGGAAIARTDVDAKKKLQCSYHQCKTKAMPLTSFCHLHILSDSKQKLYKPCGFVIKSAHTGPLTCGKPILRSTVPSLCTHHFQVAQKAIKKALKKAGLNGPSTNKLAPKFHVIVAEYVRQIQAKRRAAQRAKGKKVAIKEETSD